MWFPLCEYDYAVTDSGGQDARAGAGKQGGRSRIMRSGLSSPAKERNIDADRNKIFEQFRQNTGKNYKMSQGADDGIREDPYVWSGFPERGNESYSRMSCLVLSGADMQQKLSEFNRVQSRGLNRRHRAEGHETCTISSSSSAQLIDSLGRIVRLFIHRI